MSEEIPRFVVTDPPWDYAARRQELQADITRATGIPPELLHDAPDNPRRVFRGFDLASGLDFSAFLFFGPAGEAITAAIRSSSEAFAAMGRAIADAQLKVYEADRAFRIVWWYLLTPAQRRRAGKRLIREEIARRRIAKIRSEL